MTLLVALIGALIALLGATGLVRPSMLVGMLDSVWRTRRGFYGVVALRLCFGVILVVAAPECRYPTAGRVLGVISIVAAMLVPVLGLERVRALVDWWAARPPLLIRCWACAAIAFGGFLFHAAV